MKKALLIASTAMSSIALAFAQNNVTFGTSNQINGEPLIRLIQIAQDIFSRLIPFAITAAVVAFFWFLVRFIFKGGEDGEARKKSLSGMGLSIVALFVMVSIWGIIGFIASITGIGQGGSVPIPSVPRPN